MKKRILLTITLLFLGLVLVACGNDNASDNNGGNEGNSNNDSTDVVEIEMVSHKRELVEVWPEMAEMFHEEHPEIRVKVENPPETATVLQTRAVADNLPDIFTFPYNTSELGLIYDGYALDLTGEEFLTSNISQDVLDENKIDGKNYFVPYLANGTGVYYNVDMFDEHNLEIPTTQSEFFELLDYFESEGIMALSFTDQDAWTTGNLVDRLMGLYFDDQGELFQDIADGNASAVDHDGMRKVAETFIKMHEYGPEDSLGIAYEQGISEFANGEAAMMYQGTFTLPLIKSSNPDMNVRMFILPGETEEETRVGTNMDYGLAVSKDSENIEEVKTFLEWLTKPETAQKFHDIEGSPSLINGVESAVPELELVNEAISNGETFRIPRSFWAPGMVGELNKILQEFITTQDVDAFLERLDESVELIYNQ